MKATKKPVEIDFFTFEEFCEEGRRLKPNGIKDGFTWGFEFLGYFITYENDECYSIPTNHGIVKFTSDSVLLVQINGEIYPCKKIIFDLTYTVHNPEYSLIQQRFDRDKEMKASIDKHIASFNLIK